MRFIHKAEEGFLITLFLLALGALSAQLARRYFLNAQFPWTEELARFAFTWIVFFGAAYAMRTGGLIAVSLFVDRLPDRLRSAVALMMHLASALFFAVVAWVGAVVALKVSGLPTIAMGISSTFEYAAVPAASVLMGGRALLAAWTVWRKGQPRHDAETLI